MAEPAFAEAAASVLEGSSAAPPELVPVVFGLLGGLALFLFGLEQMTAALKAVAGERLRFVLSRLTINRLAGVATGAFVTAVIQSSSVTTVLIVSFISSGVMSLSQAVGVILGANIGTTITAQIIAFKVTKLSLLMIAVGFGLTLLSRRERLRQHGSGILGLGLVFLGMTVMGEGMEPLRAYPPFVRWMLHMESPALGMLAGAAFTAVVQSSSATTGVIIAMASQGLLSLPAGIALAFGANIGTCVTALLAAIGKPREAVRAAVVHLLFNSIGVLLWLAFIDDLAHWVVSLSPQATQLAGVEKLAAETPRQIANAHTLFNVTNTLVFLPFAGVLARIVEFLVPDRPLETEEIIRSHYLDEALIATPALALVQARRELLRLGAQVEAMLVAVREPVLRGSAEALHSVRALDQRVDSLYDQIVAYLGQVSQQRVSERDTNALMHLMSLANIFESIGDVIETDLVGRGLARIERGVSVSPETQAIIDEFHGEVASAVHRSIEAVRDEDLALAQAVVEMKPEIQALAERAAQHQARRLVADADRRLPTYALEMDVIEDLRRIYYFAKRIARGMLKSGEAA
ncbi:MAG: Na/Pi cotransporter family protein [Deltaproteobacteria bacterium]|nr:Na/Pi cotransporter family protein [Deltaproteobacteria bacterium]